MSDSLLLLTGLFLVSHHQHNSKKSNCLSMPREKLAYDMCRHGYADILGVLGSRTLYFGRYIEASVLFLRLLTNRTGTGRGLEGDDAIFFLRALLPRPQGSAARHL